MKSSQKRKVSSKTKARKTAPPPCPKCGHKQTIRSGMVKGEQRWKCKDCAYQYTRVTKRGRPIWQKSLVVFLYSYGMSLHAIGRLFQVQPSTVLKWVRLYTQEFQPSPEQGALAMMEMKDFTRQLKRASQNSKLLCIAIDDATFKKAIGISISQR